MKLSRDEMILRIKEASDNSVMFPKDILYKLFDTLESQQQEIEQLKQDIECSYDCNFVRKNKEFLDMLKRLEYVQNEAEINYCPICKGQVHEDDCELVTLLKEV